MIKRLLAVLILSWFIVNNLSAYDDLTTLPPHMSLKELHTRHFHIIYQESLESSMPYLSSQCEEAYDKLTSVFGWQPLEKIEIMFVDIFDTHNGWATSIPHNRIMIFVSGSEPGSSIFQPGNYLKRTIYHELTHVISMDMRYGYDRILSGLFGKVNPLMGDPLTLLVFYFSTSPVALAPTWYLEGLSIWAETEFAAPGRGRSSIVDMYFRCAANDNKMLPYNTWDSELPYWPYGEAPYFYGMKLIEHIDKHEKPDTPNVVGDLVQDLSHRFMFGFDEHSRKTTNMRFAVLERSMADRENRIQKDRTATLSSIPLTELSRLTKPDQKVTQPIFIGDRIFYSANEEESRDSLYEYIPSMHEARKIGKVSLTPGFGSLCRSPDGRSIYYTRIERKRNGMFWYELRRYDIEDREDHLVTDTGRYRSVSISPDGVHMAAVAMEAGRSSLIEKMLEASANPGTDSLIARGNLEEDISSPRYSPSGDLIVYVFSNEKGFSLNVYDRTRKTIATIYKSKHQILYPVWSKNGDDIIFSSDLNGVYNLYHTSIKEHGTINPLTNLLGGIFSTDISPDGKTIAAVGYDSEGYYMSLLPYDPDSLKGRTLADITLEWKEKNCIPENLQKTDQSQTVSPQKNNYSSATNIRFDYWSPWLTASSEGVMGGIQCALSDPTGYQNLFLLGGIESHYGTCLGSFEYRYSGFYPRISFYAVQTQMIYPNLVETPDQKYYDYGEIMETVGSSVDVPVTSKMDHNLSLTVGYKFTRREGINETKEKFENTEVLPIDLSEESEGSAWSGLTFVNGTVFGRSNSVEDGRIVRIMAERTSPHLGGDIFRSRYYGQWNEYINNPLFRNHVFKLSGIYAFGRGDQPGQGLFGAGGFSSGVSSPGVPILIGIRGYEENFKIGDHAAGVALAYRFPIMNTFRALTGSTPFYHRQLFAEVFYDGGMAWAPRDSERKRRWIDGMGVEINYSLKILRFLQLAPGIGFVYAPDQLKTEDDDNSDKRFQLYISIKSTINE